MKKLVLVSIPALSSVMRKNFWEYAKPVAVLLIVAGFFSCDKQSEFALGPLQKILDGYEIIAIDFDSKGNAWIVTQEKYLIRYNKNKTVIYNSKNSELPKDFFFCDIAVDRNDNVWIGTGDGVWMYNGKKFTLYNSKNTAMPEDIVWSIAVDSKNNIWLASCRMRQGGLVKYDGNKWTVYTTTNSALPVNMIHSITVDKSDNVWLALGEYVNHSYLVKISNDILNVYTEKELGFMPYWWGAIQCDSENRLWGTISYILSSYSGPHFPHFFIFDGKETTLLSYDDISGITIDNDNVWWFGGALWIDNRWIQLDISEFGGSRVRVVKEAPDHRIWFGTENGIFIRETM